MESCFNAPSSAHMLKMKERAVRRKKIVTNEEVKVGDEEKRLIKW